MSQIIDNIEIYKQILEDNLFLKLKFAGNSMYPTIVDDSIVLIKKKGDIQIGEIYVYFDTMSPTDRLVCHRLIKIDNGMFYFKGDNRDIIDVPISIDSIIGVVVDVIKKN